MNKKYKNVKNITGRRVTCPTNKSYVINTYRLLMARVLTKYGICINEIHRFQTKLKQER